MRFINGNYAKVFLRFIAGCFIAYTVIMINFSVILYEEDVYQNEFHKIGVYKKLSNADNVLDNILSFFKYESVLSKEYFTAKEISHMGDVRSLICVLNYILYVIISASILLMIIFVAMRFCTLANVFNFIKSGFNASLIIPLVFLFIYMNFRFAFSSFHKILFLKGSYVFPSNSTLITMFPLVFFKDFFLIIIMRSIFTFVILFVIITIVDKVSRLRRR